jgi:putative transcriptional regulator
MTPIKHQISDKFLMGYAAGTLPEAFDLVIATHVSLSDDVRARLESFEAVGGAVLDDIGPAELADGSLEATLARIKAMPETARGPARPSTGVFPTPLQDVVGGDLDAVKWRSAGMGVKQCVLQSSKRASARLLFIPAGQAMPKHSHKGSELTLVLQGAFRDEDARFARGDIEVADQAMNHTPTAEDWADCICLVAMDARLRFEALLPRIAQRFLGI